MKIRSVSLALVCMGSVVAMPLQAEETLRDGLRKAGRTTGEMIRDFGQGAKKAGKEVVHGTKDAGKAVGSAAAEGGREFKKAVKGDK
jgi:hypothetical protein